MATELIKRNILVVETGCCAVACGKAGLLQLEAADIAGEGLQEVCKALGILSVLHMGSCLDCSRILVMAAKIARELGVRIKDLPFGGAAPEWYSQKAVAIGSYFIGSDVYTVIGIPHTLLESKNVVEAFTNKIKGLTNSAFSLGIKDVDKIIPLAQNFDSIEEKTGVRPGQ